MATTQTDIVTLNRKLVDLLSEYGVDRAGVDAALDLALEYGETQFQFGWECAEAQSAKDN